MKKLKLWGGLVVVLALVGAGFYGWWNYDLRWRPKTIDRNQAEITRILESSGWVSPGNPGPKLYVVVFRDCADCLRYERQEFSKLHKAGVDTRVIVVARPDLNGAALSTPAERATIAELWANRSWSLLQTWLAATPESWTAPGVAPADGDLARTAVVEMGKRSAADLAPLLRQNGINFNYPLLVWWTKDGEMHGCACTRAETYRFVRKELGA